MNNFVFKIFGAPYTFDLYRGNGSEIGYFQNFDNGGKENTKLTIHRMASGKVSYSYLRYNFISSSGRPNSFFGMSVVFDGEYCKDIQKFFDLFDTIYKSIILKNGILLTELKDNPAAQAKYLVRSFSEAEGEVKNVENNIINNLKNHFANDILPLDNTFLESNSMVKLNGEMGNAAFINALRKCSWVNISSAYSTNEEPIPNPEFLATLDDTIEEVQKQIPNVSVRALKKENVQRDVYALLNGIQNALVKIDVWLEKEYKLPKGTHLNPYLQKQPDLKERHEKLLEIQKPLNDLCDVLETTTREDTENSTIDDEISGGDTDGTQQTPQNSILIFWKKHKPKIIAAVTVIVVIVAVFAGFKHFGKKSNDTATIPPTVTPVDTVKNNTAKLIEGGNTALEKDSFDLAIGCFSRANSTQNVENAKQKAVEYYQGKAADTKIKPNEAIDFLKKTKEYGGYPSVDNDIAEFQKKIDDAKAGAKRQADDAVAKEQARQAQQQLTYTNVTIQLSVNKRFSVGETLTATAKSGTTTCQDGEWRFEEGLWTTPKSNPTTVEIKSVPSTGKAKLTYWINNQKVATAEIKITP